MKLELQYKTNTYLGKKRTYILNDFFCYMYNHYKMRHNLSIYMTDFKFSTKTYELANCCYLDDWYKPRDFHIRVASDHLKTNRIFETLAHEFAHIEQYIRKRSVMKYVDGEFRHFWEGEDCTHMVQKLDKIDDRRQYVELPWEIDACKAEPLGAEFYSNLSVLEKQLFGKEEPRY